MNSIIFKALTGLAIIPVALFALSGCGGGNFGSGSSNSSFGEGLSGNYSGLSQSGGGMGGIQSSVLRTTRETYPMIETSFEIQDIKGNPFDYIANNVEVTWADSRGAATKFPAFFDGGTTWRARFTPTSSGRYTVTAITLNDKPITVTNKGKTEFNVSGPAQSGFVRIDTSDKTRFVYDNGQPYYPIGHNVAWGNGTPGDITSMFDKMGKTGENWSRVWMDAWDNKNLDWGGDVQKQPGSGNLRLDVAKRWDEIVQSADKNSIHFQFVIQHHGQYSSTTNPNWDDNPWNKKNGGFLNTPEEFFTSPEALALTKAKIRYIIARWGYSPGIMAWEIFNEVDWTDSINHKHADEVGAWHEKIAEFIRSQDKEKHLITTSSQLSLPIWKSMDYLQPHLYVSDPLAAYAAINPQKNGKPLFFGEVGPNEGLDSDDGTWLHRSLWGSLMSMSSGAAQYWAWDTVEKNNLYDKFQGAVDFLKLSGMPKSKGLQPIAPIIKTSSSGPLSFGPGAGWAAPGAVKLTVTSRGVKETDKEFPAYLQGNSHHKDFPSADFAVNYPAAGTFSVGIKQISASGAKLTISIDGKSVKDTDYPGDGKDRGINTRVTVDVPAGAHTLRIENPGVDWLVISDITLSPYAPTLEVHGKSNKSELYLWASNRQAADKKPVTGTIIIPGMPAGNYEANWLTTSTGKSVSNSLITVKADGQMILQTPEIATDMALYVKKQSGK